MAAAVPEATVLEIRTNSKLKDILRERSKARTDAKYVITTA